MSTLASAPNKLLYLARRTLDTESGVFRQRWSFRCQQDAHKPGFGPVSRYEQCPVVTPVDEPSLPDAFAPTGPASAYDGVGAASFEGGLASLPAISAALQEGEDSLGEPLAPHLIVSHEEVVFDHGGTELRIYSFLARQPELSLEEFADHWRRFIETFLGHQELARHCSAYVQDHVLALDPQPLPRFDGVAEMGFRSVEDVVAFLSEPSLVEELFPAEAPFIDRSEGIVLLTRPTAVLLGRR